MDYTNLAQSSTLAASEGGRNPANIEQLLDMSKGTVGSTVYYRPHWVASFLIDTPPQVVTLAKGVAFRAASDSAKAQMRLQYALDRALGLTVPEGMSAKPEESVTSSGTVSVPTTNRWG